MIEQPGKGNGNWVFDKQGMQVFFVTLAILCLSCIASTGLTETSTIQQIVRKHYRNYQQTLKRDAQTRNVTKFDSIRRLDYKCAHDSYSDLHYSKLQANLNVLN